MQAEPTATPAGPTCVKPTGSGQSLGALQAERSILLPSSPLWSVLRLRIPRRRAGERCSRKLSILATSAGADAAAAWGPHARRVLKVACLLKRVASQAAARAAEGQGNADRHRE